MTLKRIQLEKLLPETPSLWMTKDEFFEKLFAIIPEGRTVVSSQHGALIWNLRSLYEYGIEGRYRDVSLRLRAGSHKTPLHKLSIEEQAKIFKTAVPGRNYFWLKDVLTIPLRPWNHKGLHKPDYLKSKTPRKRKPSVKDSTTQLGENVTIQVKDGKAIITIDLAHRGSLSGSGKSIIVASTGGNQAIPGTEVVLGLNAYVKNTNRE